MTRHTITLKRFAALAILLLGVGVCVAILATRPGTPAEPVAPVPTDTTRATSPPPELRVQWSHDRSAVPGATLTPQKPQDTLTTDARGALPLDAIPKDTPITITTPGQRAPADLYTTTVPSDLARTFTLNIPSPARLSGTLLATNKPLADASISLLYTRTDTLDGLSSEETYIIDPSLRSDAQGRFALDLLPSGTFTLLIESPDHPMFTSREITLSPAEERADLSIDIAPRTALTASLLSDVSGKPVEGTLLIYDPSSRTSRRHVIRPTAPLLIESLPAERPLHLVASAPGHQHLTRTITLATGEVLDEKLSLDQAPPGISALVLSPEYLPEPGALAMYPMPNTPRPKLLRTSKQGVFRQDDASAPPTSIRVFSPRYPTSSETKLRPGEPGLIVFSRGGEITGQVLSSRNVPLTGDDYDLAVIDYAPPASERRYHRLSDGAYSASLSPQGTFALGPLRPGTYYLRATSKQGHIAYSSPIEVSAAQTTSNVTITIQLPGKVTGRVLELSSKNPIAGATVQLLEGLRQGRKKTFTTTTDAQGNFSLEDVPPGRRSLRVSHAGFVTQVAAGLEVSPGQTLSQQVAMERGKNERAFSFHGIGAVLGQDQKGVFIRQVMPNSPAEAAGVKDRDYILAIDGSVTDEMRVQDAVELIRGQENTPVRLDVRREDGTRHTLDVTRGKVKTM